MNDWSDQQLLREYAWTRSEQAFAELVRRHVDLVYSAALRMGRDAHQAQDVTQGVFIALARDAQKLTTHPVLSAWLYRTAKNISSQAIRTSMRRQAREQEAAMNESSSTGDEATWEQVALHLDGALDELNEQERDAVLLRYFERKSSREMAQILGVSDEAAQKRVSRAVDRLREIFAKRGVAVGTGGVTVLLSANAVQSAPAGLAAGIVTLAGVGTGITGSTMVASKAMVMTTLQKVLITAALVATTGAAICEARRTGQLEQEARNSRRQAGSVAEELARLNGVLNAASNQITLLSAANDQLRSDQNSAELLRLRAEVTRLQGDGEELKKWKTAGVDLNDHLMQHFLDLRARALKISQRLDQMPDEKIPELKLLADEDWLTVVNGVTQLDTDADFRNAFRRLRALAKNRMPMGRSLFDYLHANDGQLPDDLSQLKPYFKSALGTAAPDDATIDEMFDRYTLLHTGYASNYATGTYFIVEKAPVDRNYDSRAKFGSGSSTVIDTGIGLTGAPDDAAY